MYTHTMIILILIATLGNILTNLGLPMAQPGAVVYPERLRIPTIQVDAPVEAVGLGTDGAMGVPSSPDRVAWFEQGTVPGAVGNAVIAGHLDSKTGPAVFWDLTRLKPGDTIEIDLNDGRTQTFIVRSIQRYKDTEAPLELIFGTSFTTNLNLITCGGYFDQVTRNYEQRIVVYTSLSTTDLKGIESIPYRIAAMFDRIVRSFRAS